MLHVSQAVPLLVKILYTVGVSVVVPVYWYAYGPSNFLWFSDLALLLTSRPSGSKAPYSPACRR